jgi:ABC-type Mn2+/Zn2+ transport system ATPase subunit
VRILGRPLAAMRGQVGWLPQRAAVDWDFPASPLDVVAMARTPRIRWFGPMPRREREAARAALTEVGMGEFADRQIGRLSGGQQQRVFLARALAQEPHILLMDEPFTGVDVTTQEAVLGVLDGLRRQQVTVMVSTHDLNLAAQRFDLVLLLNRRMVAYGTPAEVFTTEHVRHAFGGQALMLGGEMVVVDQCCPHEELPILAVE